MRHIKAKVDVTLGPDPDGSGLRPVAFRYLRQTFKIAAVLDCWTETGRWWEQETEATIWRVQDARGGVYELAMRQVQPPEWWLMVVWD